MAVGASRWSSGRGIVPSAEPHHVMTTDDNPPSVSYGYHMVELFKTTEFDEWLRALRDRRAVARIVARIDRLASGNPGDVKPVGKGLSEMRIDYGPGYRVYLMHRGPIVIVLLCGGDKTTQQRDIERAKVLAAEWKD